MNIWIAIPTGQRTNQVVEVVQAWRRLGFRVAVYTWDDATAKALLKSKYIILERPVCELLLKGKQERFGVLQNLMAERIPGWDVLICGADDLWPVSKFVEIAAAARAAPDKMIWARDGFFNKQPTHPIITRGWYEAHGRTIFNEYYRHNFVDTDLFVRCALDGSVVKCFDLAFDHHHPFTGNSKIDAIYRQGQSSYRLDEVHFNLKWDSRLKAGLPSIRTMRLYDDETEKSQPSD